MSILAVTATKPHADSKLGFNYRVTDTSVVVTSVDPAGLFGRTKLRADQEIIGINGTRITKFDRDVIRSLLASLPGGEVTLIVKSTPPSTDGATFECKAVRKNDKLDVQSRMKASAEDMPKVLRDAGVPRRDWLLIYYLVAEELLPVAARCVEGNEAYCRDMAFYQSVQASQYTNLHVEKKAHMSGVQTGMLHNNVALVAMAVKDRVNSILWRYRAIAVLAYDSIQLPRYPWIDRGREALRHAVLATNPPRPAREDDRMPMNEMVIAVGFHFYAMEQDAVRAIPTAPVAQPGAPVAQAWRL